MSEKRLFARQEKIVMYDPSISNKEKYLTLIKEINNSFSLNTVLSNAIINVYAEILNYAASIDHALDYLNDIYDAYAAQMHRSTDKTVDNKLHVLKETAKDYLATCTDELA